MPIIVTLSKVSRRLVVSRCECSSCKGLGGLALFLALTTSADLLRAEAIQGSAVVQEVIVEAEHQATADELGLSTLELSGDELTAKLGATLGDTLADEPGVHNASYGPGVGLPVLRGLSGVRIRLSEDGIGAWDASSISPDHATAIEPVLATSIKVVKGPATVIHGNNAIGGTVEVTHGRIAESLSDQVHSAMVEVRTELVNEHERESYVGKVRTESGPFVLQLDGFLRNSKDMSIPGIAIQEEAIGEVFGITNSDNTFGTVINTDSDAFSGSAALSFVDDTFFIGVSSTIIDNQYGIPPGAHTEPEDSPGHSHTHPIGDNIAIQSRVRIDLEQERHLLKLGGVLDSRYFDEYQVTAGKVNYEHNEFEIDPVTAQVFPGTRFLNEVVEIKAELTHSLLGFLNSEHVGKAGVQWVDREFSAKSERVFGGENFIPATDHQAIGAFFYEQFPLSRGGIEIGGRYEWQEIAQRELTAPLLPDNLQFFHQPITYETYTFSSALTLDLSDQQRFIVNLNSAQRAPEIQELLSLGSHLATRSYDVGLLISRRQAGQDAPSPEKFYGAETRWEYQGDYGELNTAVFYTEVKDFVYQTRPASNALFDISDDQFRPDCVNLEECVAVFVYTQSDVTFAGYEWQWFWPAVALANGEFQVEIFGDYVRGKIDNNGDLPRMPPRRKGIGMRWENDSVTANIRYSRVSAQDDPGENETATEAYQLLNANLAYTLHIDQLHHSDLMVFLQMKNLLDQDIRKSTSFLRNFTPEPGREISLGLRYQF